MDGTWEEDELGRAVICEVCGALVCWEDCLVCGDEDEPSAECPICQGEGAFLVCEVCEDADDPQVPR